MFDYRIGLISIMVVMILLIISSTVNSFDSDDEIKIEGQLYEKAVDIVTDYSMKSTDDNDKHILIYLSTFHLFDMNFNYDSVKKLDDKLRRYPYVPSNVAYPTGNMHHNLQKAIITHITEQITISERQLIHDRKKDRAVIDLYLSSLFTGINVKK